MWSCGAAVTRSSANDLGLYHGVCSTSANYVTTWPSYCDRTGHQNVKEFMLWLLPHCHLSRLTPLCMEWQPCILADRCQTVPNVCWWPIFIKLGQKFTSPKKIGSSKTSNIRTVSDNFPTCPRVFLECNTISVRKIALQAARLLEMVRFCPQSVKNRTKSNSLWKFYNCLRMTTACWCIPCWGQVFPNNYLHIKLSKNVQTFVYFVLYYGSVGRIALKFSVWNIVVQKFRCANLGCFPLKILQPKTYLSVAILQLCHRHFHSAASCRQSENSFADNSAFLILW